LKRNTNIGSWRYAAERGECSASLRFDNHSREESNDSVDDEIAAELNDADHNLVGG
jgi:hypothetical protein